MIQSRYKKLNHVKRLLVLGLGVFCVLILFCIGSGYMIHAEIMSTYLHNYQALEAAGFSDIIASTGAFSDRLLVLISMIPLVGAGLVLPIFLKAACEIRDLSEELGRLVDKDV